MDYTRNQDARLVGAIILGAVVVAYTSPVWYKFWLGKDYLYLDNGGLGMEHRNSSVGYIQTRQALYGNDFGRVAFGHEELGKFGPDYRI